MSTPKEQFEKYQKNIQEKTELFKTRPEIIGQLMFLNDIINHLNTKLWHLEDAAEPDAKEEKEHSQKNQEVVKESLQVEEVSDFNLDQDTVEKLKNAMS